MPTLYETSKNSTPAITFYLTSRSLAKAQAGTHEMFNAVRTLGEHRNFEVKAARISSQARDRVTPAARTLTHMANPVGHNGLVFRRLYAGRFWQFDYMSARWNWAIARAKFDPNIIDKTKSLEFFDQWRDHLYPNAVQNTADVGFIYMPLQGRLLLHRSFQVMSPIMMIQHTLQNTTKPIVATLHPNETYSDAEMAALHTLQDQHARFAIEQLPMEQALATCSYVVTQNSSAAFHAMFWGKLSVLFAGIDFHHICINVASLGAQRAFELVQTARPQFAAFLYWYWKLNAVDLDDQHLTSVLAQKLTSLGWEFQEQND
ncbi:hypothetical protein [Octadecabacter ascidiaceicola]|uniref:Capsule polysaccharide biosynthesis protein n=1 Tax=Octadecabacter ascidiaceicola TaxID=1655543 RepID=A0A238K453_9RHOB|nr:hypothetical protein [Octadecabacter ascidiaceicola]SMX37543.1 hypothetical protein OCA8868_01483 [Octadecabacter ascidiaceicola]